jgi:hypothetical protein
MRHGDQPVAVLIYAKERGSKDHKDKSGRPAAEQSEAHNLELMSSEGFRPVPLGFPAHSAASSCLEKSKLASLDPA